MDIKGSDLFVKALKAEGVDLVFAYPGGYVIDLFDALYDEPAIEVILPRHEQALVHAADGYARSTGKVGVCLVTSGPGATNMITGIATAHYDSVPLVCFAGQVTTEALGDDAFQEADIVGMTRSICKYAVTVRDREKLGQIIKNAFYLAKIGKPGVVIVDFPRDIQKNYGCAVYPTEAKFRGHNPRTIVPTQEIKKAIQILSSAKKPVFLLGNGVKIANAQKEATDLAQMTGVPVVTTIMGKGALNTNHPLYVGNLGMHGSYAANKAISECDVLLSIGVRFNDRITGKASAFAPNATIIHIDIDAASISRNIAVNLTITADAKAAINEILKHAFSLDLQDWQKEIYAWKTAYPLAMKAPGMTPEMIIAHINKRFKHVIVVTDVGQNQLWTTQFLDLDEHRKLLTSGGFGTMGYGFPAAIGAKLGNPAKEVICISGDGGMQMNIQEMATAVALELPLILCVFNNSYLGNVRQWQEMFFNKRYASTCLRYRKRCRKDCQPLDPCCPAYIPDFVKLAESYGAKGLRIDRIDDIEKGFTFAKSNTDAPTILEFIIAKETNVLPIVPNGNALDEMIMECSGVTS